MVAGLDKFGEYFGSFPDSYVVIGGTACDLLLEAEGLTARRTKDIDIVLVTKHLSDEFIKKIWEFVRTGDYQSLEKDATERKYYRFSNPRDKSFPRQIELFSQHPDGLDGDGGSRFTSITCDGARASLSAILMDQNFYSYTIEHSSLISRIKTANVEALICLKAKAYLDLEERLARGDEIDDNDIKKHKNDVFRLVTLLPSDAKLEYPKTIEDDVKSFIDRVRTVLPGDEIFRVLGAPQLTAEQVLAQLESSIKSHA